eukprot:jgi/Mesvir1/16701/Mv15094-RA.2
MSGKRSLWSSFFRTRDRFSLEELSALHDQLMHISYVNDANKDMIVETLRSIAELMIWGDQHEPRFLDFFLEKQIMSHFLRILSVSQRSSRRSPVAVQLLQSLSIMIQNITSETAIYYLFSNNHVNDLIQHPFSFEDEEVMAYYISFLRTISLKLNERTVQFFFRKNEDPPSFPLYTEAIKFFKHEESMVRIAVRTLTLKIYSVRDPSIQKFLMGKNVIGYFGQLVDFIRHQCMTMDRIITSRGGRPGQFSAVTAEALDLLHYCNDILARATPQICAVLTRHLMHNLVLPLLLGSLLPGGNSQDGSLSPLCAMFLLSQFISTVCYPPMLNAIAARLARRELASTPHSVIYTDGRGASYFGSSSSTGRADWDGPLSPPAPHPLSRLGAKLEVAPPNPPLGGSRAADTSAARQANGDVGEPPSSSSSKGAAVSNGCRDGLLSYLQPPGPHGPDWHLPRSTEASPAKGIASSGGGAAAPAMGLSSASSPDAVHLANQQLIAALSVLAVLSQCKRVNGKLLDAVGVRPVKSKGGKKGAGGDGLTYSASADLSIFFTPSLDMEAEEEKRSSPTSPSKSHHVSMDILALSHPVLSIPSIAHDQAHHVSMDMVRYPSADNDSDASDMTTGSVSGAGGSNAISIAGGSTGYSRKHAHSLAPLVSDAISATASELGTEDEADLGRPDMDTGSGSERNGSWGLGGKEAAKGCDGGNAETRWEEEDSSIMLQGKLSPEDLGVDLETELRELDPHLIATHRREVVELLLCLVSRLDPPPIHALHLAGYLLRALLLPGIPNANSALLQQLHESYEESRAQLWQEMEGVWCDVVTKVVADEWVHQRREMASPSVLNHHHAMQLLLPPKPTPPYDPRQTTAASERMQMVAKVFLCRHLLWDSLVRGTLPQPPASVPTPRVPSLAGPGGNHASTEPVTEGSEVEFSGLDSLPCRVAFERGKERALYLVVMTHAHPTPCLVLAEASPVRLGAGIVRAIAPLAGAQPRVNQTHPKWLHLCVRAPLQIVRPYPSEEASRKRLTDGTWTLAFADEARCASAQRIVDERIASLQAACKEALSHLIGHQAVRGAQKAFRPAVAIGSLANST